MVSIQDFNLILTILLLKLFENEYYRYLKYFSGATVLLKKK